MYTGQNIVKLAYGDRLIRPKSPKVKTLPIAYNITEAHTDFPIYIKPSSITGFGSLTLAEAQSLRFYADAGKTTELPREIVSADEIYVKTDLSAGTGNKLFYTYDGVSPDYADNDDYGKYNVWNSNYKAVYHFEGNANDSTSNGLNLTTSNVSYSSGYASFNGSNSQAYLKSAITSTNTLTMQVLRYGNNKTTQQFIVNVNSKNNNTPDGGCAILSDGKLRAAKGIQGVGWNDYIDTSSSINISTSYLGHIVYNGTTFYYYLDGSLVGSKSTNNNNIGPDIMLGCHQNNTGNQDNTFNGRIYEARIIASAFSSTRISTEHANQSNPATFFGTLT